MPIETAVCYAISILQGRTPSAKRALPRNSRSVWPIAWPTERASGGYDRIAEGPQSLDVDLNRVPGS